MKKGFIVFLFLVGSVSAANVYIDPTTDPIGDGSCGNPYDSWDDISFNVANDYYQKSGTTWTHGTGVAIDISGKTATAGNRMVLGAYYESPPGTCVIGVSGAKPILENTGHVDGDKVLKLLNVDYIHLQNLDLRGGYKLMTWLGGVNYFLMEDCIVGKGAYQYGIYANSGTGSNDPSNYGIIRNCVFDSDIGNSGARPHDEGGTLEDGCFLRDGHSYWEVYDNEFIDWPHGAVVFADDSSSSAVTSYNKIHDNYIHRGDAADIAAYGYCRGLGSLGGPDLHHNEWYNNLIEGTTIRSQFGGHNNKIYNNIIDTVTDEVGRPTQGPAGGIMLTSTTNKDRDAKENEIFNNIIINTNHAAIELGGNKNYVQDNIIANNIMYNCGSGYKSSAIGTSIYIRSGDFVLENHFYNNIIYNNKYTDAALYKSYGSRYTVAEWNAANGMDGNTMIDNIAENPLFVDPENGDFRLLPGSPAIDAGIDMGQTEDYFGNPIVGPPDIGVYEYQGTQQPTCQSQGYECCSSCLTTNYAAFEADCPELCCDACATTLFSPDEYIEAEDGELTNPMQTGTDQSASAGQFIQSLTTNQGMASFTFNITQQGNYYLQALVKTPPTAGAHNSIFIGFDDNTIPGNEYYTWDTIETVDFAWDNVSIRGITGTHTEAEFDPMTWELVPGIHTLYIFGREPSTQLDQIILKPYTETQCSAGADSDGDSVIEISELINFISEWKSGSILIGELINAIGEWKSGC